MRPLCLRDYQSPHVGAGFTGIQRLDPTKQKAEQATSPLHCKSSGTYMSQAPSIVSLEFDGVCLDTSNKNKLMWSGKCFLSREYRFCLCFLLVCIYACCTFSCPKSAQAVEMVCQIEGVMEAGRRKSCRARAVSSECWSIKLRQAFACVQTGHIDIKCAAQSCVHGGKAVVV